MASTSLILLPAAVLDVALSDLAAGVHEDLGHNDGTFLRDVYGNVPGDNWCALATRSWITRAAERLGVVPPIPGSAGAKATMEQFIAAGRWIPAGDLTPARVQPGMVSVWDRADGNPDHAWWGHIGVVETPGVDGGYTSIEGNSGLGGTQVARMTRNLDNAKLLGMGWLGDASVAPPRTSLAWLGAVVGVAAGWYFARRLRVVKRHNGWWLAGR